MPPTPPLPPTRSQPAARARGPRVYICHAQEDAQRLQPLVSALAAWGLTCFFETQAQVAGMPLSDRAQQAIATCDIFLRVCSEASQKSYWAGLEQGAFLSLQAEDYRAGRQDARMLVNLLIDEKYLRQPFDNGALNVVAFKRPAAQWVNELRGILGLAPLPPQEIPPITFAVGRAAAASASGQPVSRRKVIGAGVAGAAALAVIGGTGALLVTRRLGGGASIAPPGHAKASGELLWKQQLKEKVVAAPVAANGLVYVGALDNVLYAFSTAGTPKWSYPAHANAAGKGIYAAPALANGMLYTYGHDDYISALDPSNGSVIWTTTPPTGKGTGALGYAAPVVANGVLYVASYEESPGTLPGVLKGLDATTGKELPGEALNTFVSSTPRVEQDVLYVASYSVIDDSTNGLPAYDGYFFACDTKHQLSELWKVHTGEVDFSSAAIANGVAYICSSAPDTAGTVPTTPDNPTKDKGYLQAIDLASHKLLWKFPAGKTLYSSPLVANGLVFFGADDHNVYAIHATTGLKQWSFATRKSVLASPVLANGVLYIGSHDGNVYALDPQTGSLIRSYATGGAINGAVAVVDGTLYVGAYDKYLYAFKV